MLMKRLLTVMATAVVACVTIAAQPLFRTNELKRMADVMHLSISESTLHPGLDSDTTWSYKGRPLHVVTNQRGDVCHIGMPLFSKDFMRLYDDRDVFYFLERLALQQMLPESGDDRDKRRARQNKVTFVKGDSKSLIHITPDVPCTLDQIERKGYRVTWTTAEGDVVVSLPADYQLLNSAEARELEEIMARDLPRTPQQDITHYIIERMCQTAERSRASDNTMLLSYGNYLSDRITSDVTVTRQHDGSYTTQYAASLPLRSVRNLLLTGASQTQLSLHLTMDRYGYKTTAMQITLQQFLRYCLQENCTLYVGIKQHNDTHVTATLFALNKNMGYNHMLSVTIPLTVLTCESNVISGRLYSYIPLQDVADSFFNTTYIKVTAGSINYPSIKY